eukprot:s4107_g1.t1
MCQVGDTVDVKLWVKSTSSTQSFPQPSFTETEQELHELAVIQAQVDSSSLRMLRGQILEADNETLRGRRCWSNGLAKAKVPLRAAFRDGVPCGGSRDVWIEKLLEPYACNAEFVVHVASLCAVPQLLGVHKLKDGELREMISALDVDQSGDISLYEFDKALRLAEKKARFEGREELVDTWKVPPELMLDFGQKYDWSKRTMKFDGKYTGEDVSTMAQAGSELMDQSLEFDEDLNESQWNASQMTSQPSTLLNAASHRWMQASTGPWGAAVSAPVGSGNLHDNFIFRQRLVDNTWASRPPKIEHERLPLYRYGRFKRAIAETRWGAEPVQVPEPMLKSRDGCLTASRPRRLADLDRGREKFNAPLLKSVIDSVVFGHDLDFSNDKSCNDSFKAKFQGAYGKASWFTSEEDLGSGLFRHSIV